MYTQQDQDGTSAVTLRLLSKHPPAAACALDSEHSGQAARAAGGAQLLLLRWLAGRPRVTALALAAAGWAAAFAAVITGSHLGRGAVVQVIFAATMVTAATGETLLSPASPVIIDDRVPPVAAGRYKRLGTLAFVTGCLLGPPVSGAALGADWGTSLLATFAVACAVASIAAHRLGRQLAPGINLVPVGGASGCGRRHKLAKGSEMSIIVAIRQTTSGRGSRSVTTPAKRVRPNPGDPGSTPGCRPAGSCRTEQLPPAKRVRARGSQMEVNHVQP